MLSQATLVLSVTLITLFTATLASEPNEETCLQQDVDCMVQLNNVSLLQVQSSSYYAMVKRESSLVDREAEAQMAFLEIRDQLRAHPKVAKQALHEALVEIQQASNTWPFTTGASQIFSPQSGVDIDANIPHMQKTKSEFKLSHLAAQQGENQQANEIAAPVEPLDSNDTAAKPAKPDDNETAAKPVKPEEPADPLEISPLDKGGNETAAAKPERAEKSTVAPSGEDSNQTTAAQPAKAEKPAEGVQIAPFGKEDTARELTQHAVDTQDTLVDAVENAEVAEVKRSVFRALTRLRAASIKEFDTIARLETQAFDEYNDAHHFRVENPLQHLHSSEPKVKEDKYTSFH